MKYQMCHILWDWGAMDPCPPLATPLLTYQLHIQINLNIHQIHNTMVSTDGALKVLQSLKTDNDQMPPLPAYWKTLQEIDWIFSQVMAHYDKCNILTDVRHSFRHGRSCESQHDHYHYRRLVKSLDNREQVDAVILGIWRVLHQRLLPKLHHNVIISPRLL